MVFSLFDMKGLRPRDLGVAIGFCKCMVGGDLGNSAFLCTLAVEIRFG